MKKLTNVLVEKLTKALMPFYIDLRRIVHVPSMGDFSSPLLAE